MGSSYGRALHGRDRLPACTKRPTVSFACSSHTKAGRVEKTVEGPERADAPAPARNMPASFSARARLPRSPRSPSTRACRAPPPTAISRRAGKMISAVVDFSLGPVRAGGLVDRRRARAHRGALPPDPSRASGNTSRSCAPPCRSSLSDMALERAGRLTEETLSPRPIASTSSATQRMPLKPRLPQARFRPAGPGPCRWSTASRPYVVLRDIWGARDREIQAIARWIADALVEAALRDGRPTSQARPAQQAQQEERCGVERLRQAIDAPHGAALTRVLNSGRPAFLVGRCKKHPSQTEDLAMSFTSKVVRNPRGKNGRPRGDDRRRWPPPVPRCCPRPFEGNPADRRHRLVVAGPGPGAEPARIAGRHRAIRVEGRALRARARPR